MSPYWRRKAKKDANHAPIVEALTAQGWTVGETHGVGGGFPDVVVGAGGRCFLGEIKREADELRGGLEVAGKKRGRLQNATNERQRLFKAWWRGYPVLEFRSPGQAVAAVLLALEMDAAVEEAAAAAEELAGDGTIDETRLRKAVREVQLVRSAALRGIR